MDRYWLLTWTTYGTWLPGDTRGSVTRLRTAGTRVEEDVPGTPYTAGVSGLVGASRAALRGEPAWLTERLATLVAESFAATARYRGWELSAGAVMPNHVHLAVGVAGDPEPSQLLQVFKSYAARALNLTDARTHRSTWWTASGSTRKLATEESRARAVSYVEGQHGCLAQCEKVPGERGTTVPRDPQAGETSDAGG